MKLKIIFLFCLAISSSATAESELVLEPGTKTYLGGLAIRCESVTNKCVVRPEHSVGSLYRVYGADGYPLTGSMTDIDAAVAALKRLINDGVCSRS